MIVNDGASRAFKNAVEIFFESVSDFLTRLDNDGRLSELVI